jgi:uncharacterized protein (DUF2141 family)
MKTLITLIILGFFGITGPEQGTLEVEVSNIKSMEGYVYLQIFSNEDDFMKNPTKRAMVKFIEGESVILKVEDLPFGNYSVSIMHDQNMNGEMDSGTFGIPKEGYGFSNNAKGMFGPPSYEDTQFTFDKNMKLSIDLIHPPF